MCELCGRGNRSQRAIFSLYAAEKMMSVKSLKVWNVGSHSISLPISVQGIFLRHTKSLILRRNCRYMVKNRLPRLNSLIKEVLSEVIRKHVKNPHVTELVTVTRVDITKDLHHA